MNARQLALLLLCVAGVSLGQIAFKKAALLLGDASGWRAWAGNGWLWAAIVLYGAMTLFWAWLLRLVPLQSAYPFMGLAFLLVPLLAAWLLDEPLQWQSIAGGGLILAGVALAAQTTRG